MIRYLSLLVAAAGACSAAAVEAGKAAPPLALTQILHAPAGSSATWEALKGKAVVLEFWATWCEPCVEQLPHLNSLVERFQNRPVTLLSITDEAPDLIARFLKDRPIAGWVGLDGQGKTFDAYAVNARPTTVLVDATGVVRAVGHPKELTDEVMQDFLAGKTVSIVGQPGQVDTQALPQPVFEVSLRPASPVSVTHVSPGGRMKYGSGSITYGISLANMLSQVYAVPAWRVDGPAWIAEDRYDVTEVLPGAPPGDSDGLKIALEQAFRIKVHKETRDVAVLELRRIAGTEPKATPATSGRSHSEGKEGDYQIHALPLNWLIHFAPETLDRPIFDETGIKGNYDYQLKWDPADQQSFLSAVRAQVGLDLVPAHRQLEYLVVDSALRPGAR
jgi:uncharacterized protein (TIGR03435 family)